MKPLPTTEKLAHALMEAGAPDRMVQRARTGAYDNYKSRLANPIGYLIEDARDAELWDIISRARRGEFDGTEEEADAWYQKEAQNTLRELRRNVPRRQRRNQ